MAVVDGATLWHHDTQTKSEFFITCYKKITQNPPVQYFKLYKYVAESTSSLSCQMGIRQTGFEGGYACLCKWLLMAVVWKPSPRKLGVSKFHWVYKSLQPRKETLFSMVKAKC